jgi:hypothetical protein
MKRFFLVTYVLALLFAFGCTKDYSDDGYYDSDEDAGDEQNLEPGVITAGEWNDLDNWDFWNNVLNNQEYSTMPTYWKFFHNNRVSVVLSNGQGTPIIDAVVELKRNSTTIFTARTDNFGKAELWADLFQHSSEVDPSSLSISINNGAYTTSGVKFYQDGINEIAIASTSSSNRVELSFVVDATGSMGDELEFLKTELLDVIERVKDDNPNVSLYTSSVFYRDENDQYVTRVSPFTNSVQTTINFIKDQKADGGGDYPEAVHTALEKAIGELQWSYTARTRLLFLVLDAPPHYTTSVIQSIQESIALAAEKGIKIIPVTASGIDKKTEFLMRFFAISTNGTYVFITDHSGVGNSHLEPTVGEYQVEFLNNLMVRLINKYAE